MNLQQHHGAMLLKYAGISFISGAVNHGFFSEQRSLWTAAIGMVLFVMGAWMEHRLRDPQADVPQTGLLHTLVLGGSYGAWQWLEQHPEWAATGHSHDNAHGDEHTHDDTADHEHGQSTGPSALVISRSIEVRMDDQMRFTPSNIQVNEGETIRFVVHNAGRATHEMVLGSDAAIQAHAQAMQQGAGHDEGHSHGTGAAITVAAGQKGELVVKFDQAGTWQMACLIPGHYEAGMRGSVSVQPAKAAHDHSTHTH